MEKLEQIKEDLKEILSEKRYIHSIGVMEMSEHLAKIYNEDVEEAKLAGLLHDIAKEMSEEEMLNYLEKNNIEVTEVERINTKILHGKIGADIAKKKYNVSKKVADAIKYHTTTSVEMDMLAKIVFVSDKIELNRPSTMYNVEYKRFVAEKDINKAMLLIINDNIIKLVSKGILINKESIDTRNKILIENLK